MVLFDNNTYHNINYYHTMQINKKNEISRFNMINQIHITYSINIINELQSITKSPIDDKSKTSNVQRNFNETCTKPKRDNG